MAHTDRTSRVPGAERRTTPRVGVDLWVEEHCGAGVYYHRVTNLSPKGFFVDKRIPFPVGRIVTIRLDLPHTRQRLEARTRVVNNYHDAQANLLGAGFQFLELDVETRRGIEALMQGAGSRSRGPS